MLGRGRVNQKWERERERNKWKEIWNIPTSIRLNGKPISLQCLTSDVKNSYNINANKNLVHFHSQTSPVFNNNQQKMHLVFYTKIYIHEKFISIKVEISKSKKKLFWPFLGRFKILNTLCMREGERERNCAELRNKKSKPRRPTKTLYLQQATGNWMTKKKRCNYQH